MMHMPLVIGGLIDHAAARHGGTEVISVETGGGQVRSTWGHVAQNARRLASALERLGVPMGAACGTLAWNNRRHLEVYFGVSSSGRICHTINPRLHPDQLHYIMDHAQDVVLFLDRTFVPLVAPLLARLPALRHVVLLGPVEAELAAMVPGLLSYDDLLDSGDAGFVWPELDELTPSSLCYTSGTTGNPKGVLYTHRSTVLHSLAGNQPDMLGITASDTVMPVVPMFHVNAWGVPYVAAMTGCRLVLPGPGLDGDSLVALIDGERVTMALGVPTIWLGLLGALERTGSRAESLKRTVIGGSALPPAMLATFRDRYGVDAVHAWGMTEMSPLGTVNSLMSQHLDAPPQVQADRRLNQGRTPWGVQMRVVAEDGTPLPEDGQATGNLQVRGPWVLSRYYRSDKPALTEDGWFDTGDIASIDAEGYLTIRDRAKDIVKSGGEWISTVDIENIAMAHPGIANAACIAATHPKWDERPVLVAIKRPGAEVDEAGVLAFYDGKVAKWQVPDRVIFVDALPLGGTGKVLKTRLRELYGDVLLEE